MRAELYLVEKSEPLFEGYRCLCVWRLAGEGRQRAVSPRALVAIGCFHYNKMMKAPE